MTRPYLIGLAGYAGAGKSAVAKILADHHGFARGRFAGPLKAMLAAALRAAGTGDDEIIRMVDGDLKDAPSEALSGHSPRYAMQTLGTEWGRACMGEAFWLSIAAAGIDRMQAEGLPAVLDDVRFQNEADLIRARGGIVLKIERPGVGPVNDHVSDALAFAVDGRIINDGPLEILEERVLGWIDRLKSWQRWREAS